MTAQRSTKRYCSEACKQRAKRVMERAARAGEAACLECGREIPGYRTEAERTRIAARSGSNVIYAGRKYCGRECRQKAAARRRAYRVAEAGQEAPYQVAQGDGNVIITLPERAPEEALRRILAVAERRGGLAVVVVPDGPQFREFRDRADPFGGPDNEIAVPMAAQEAGSASPQPGAAAAQDLRTPDLSIESFFSEGHVPSGPVDPAP